MLGETIEILLVEDDQQDIDLTLEVMKMSKLKVNFNVVNDGVDAMDFLLKKGNFTGAKKPDLILLDLNLPRKDGREVLQEIKTYETLKDIPVVVLTTSSDNEDIIRSYMQGASCYITKPVGLDEFKNVVSTIDNFWFTIVKLPQKS